MDSEIGPVGTASANLEAAKLEAARLLASRAAIDEAIEARLSGDGPAMCAAVRRACSKDPLRGEILLIGLLPGTATGGRDASALLDHRKDLCKRHKELSAWIEARETSQRELSRQLARRTPGRIAELRAQLKRGRPLEAIAEAVARRLAENAHRWRGMDADARIESAKKLGPEATSVRHLARLLANEHHASEEACYSWLQRLQKRNREAYLEITKTACGSGRRNPD